MNDDDLDIEKIQNEFLSSQCSFINNSPVASQIDYDYIDFKYLEANSANINFTLDKEWKKSSCLDEIRSLEQELAFDTDLTFEEKKVLLKSSRRDDIEPKCKFCSKLFRISGKALINHESKCLFNPIFSPSLTLKTFKSKILTSNGNCPKCSKFFKKLRYHANECFEKSLIFHRTLAILIAAICMMLLT